jgi:hypothetical protein
LKHVGLKHSFTRQMKVRAPWCWNARLQLGSNTQMQSGQRKAKLLDEGRSGSSQLLELWA